MNKKYKKGYLFERRVRKYLEKRGYRVFRLAGSKPADLIAMNKENTFLIECKVRDKPSKKTIHKIIELVADTPAKPLIALRINRKLIFIDPTTLEEVEI